MWWLRHPFATKGSSDKIEVTNQNSIPTFPSSLGITFSTQYAPVPLYYEAKLAEQDLSPFVREPRSYGFFWVFLKGGLRTFFFFPRQDKRQQPTKTPTNVRDELTEAKLADFYSNLGLGRNYSSSCTLFCQKKKPQKRTSFENAPLTLVNWASRPHDTARGIMEYRR